MRAVWIALVLALMLAGCAVETDVPPVSTSGADTPTVSSVPPPSPPILDSNPMSEITAEPPDAEEQAVVSLCTRYIELHYNAELLGEVEDPAPLFADGLAFDYATLKFDLFAMWRSQSPSTVYNLSVATTVQEMESAEDEAVVVVKAAATYQNNEAGTSAAERGDTFHLRLLKKDGCFVIEDVFNFDAIDTLCRGVTPQSDIDSNRISAEHVEALRSILDKNTTASCA